MLLKYELKGTWYVSKLSPLNCLEVPVGSLISLHIYSALLDWLCTK